MLPCLAKPSKLNPFRSFPISLLQVHYALNMLNNILDVNKIKTGSFKTNNAPFDLEDLMRRATTMQAVKAQGRGVMMSFDPPQGPCIAYTDEDIVSRIVTNFISNAVKFTSSGAIQPFILPASSIERKFDDVSSIDIEGESVKVRMVAVGVADTGPGLTQELLNLAEAGLFNSDSQGMNSGAKNSGFGLHLAHQLAGTLGTRIHLSDLSYTQGLFNADIAKAVKEQKSGTVLFVVVPVFEDGNHGKEKVLDKKSRMDVHGSGGLPRRSFYRFSPQPSMAKAGDSFRILIADDVLMLRKGLVRSVLQLFKAFPKGWPLTVHTACSAEDMLRSATSLPFDLIICDNQFGSPTNLRSLSADNVRRGIRPHITYGGESSGSKLQELVSDFFRLEEFSIEDGDGNLSGLQALTQLLATAPCRAHGGPGGDAGEGGAAGLPHPIPIVMLLSGHKFDLDPGCGIIVVQKPMKTAEFIPVLEAHARRLVGWGLCLEEGEDGVDPVRRSRVVNMRGTQIFSWEGEEVEEEEAGDDAAA